MKARVEYRPYCVPFLRPLQTAHGLWRERRGVLARRVDAAGRVSYAEAAPLPWSAGPEGAEGAAALFPAARWEQAPPPLACKTRDTHDTHRREVAALLPAGRAAVEALRARRSEGFRTFKWKVGVARDLAEEFAILEELCAELSAGEPCAEGAGVREPVARHLRLDANGGWTQREAERWLTRCAQRDVAGKIEFIEQPIWAGASATQSERRRERDVLLGLSADYPTWLALDESVGSDAAVREWLEWGWRGVFVVKPTLLAEPAAVLGELARAEARVVFSSAMETAVGAQAALRWAFAWEGRAARARREEPVGELLALGFGVYPLFDDAVLNGPRAVPFLSAAAVEAINPEAVWNALK